MNTRPLAAKLLIVLAATVLLTSLMATAGLRAFASEALPTDPEQVGQGTEEPAASIPIEEEIVTNPEKPAKGSDAAMGPANNEPIDVHAPPSITPIFPDGDPAFAFEDPPTFEIGQAMAYDQYIVELSLAGMLFNEPDAGEPNTLRADYILGHPTIQEPNFYRSDAQWLSAGQGTFQVPEDVWTNLRGSVVFFRVAAFESGNPDHKTYSTPDGEGADAPSINRACGDWLGLPLNDQAIANTQQAVVDGRLNLAAQESDLGPRGTNTNYTMTRFHPGIDIPVDKGTPLYATAQGIIANNLTDGMGRLDVTYGEYTLGYVHLYAAVLQAGEPVVAGQLIGYSGDRGFPGDEHLHLDTGNRNGQSYVNPLNYIRTNADPAEAPEFLLDPESNQPIRVEPALHHGQEHLAIVGFRIGSGFEKDIAFISAQAGKFTAPGQYFALNYANVEPIDGQPWEGKYRSGLIRMHDQDDLVIIPSPTLDTRNLYDTNLALAHRFYAQPSYTDTSHTAEDAFYFIWDTSFFAGNPDAGPQTITVKARDLSGNDVKETATIGVEINPIPVDQTSDTVALEIDVTNHDVPNESAAGASIGLSIVDLPLEWAVDPSDIIFRDGSEIFSDPSQIPFDPGQTRRITIEFSGVNRWISPDLLAQSNTRIAASHGRFPALQDEEVICRLQDINPSMSILGASGNGFQGALCPIEAGQLEITFPGNGQVEMGTSIEVAVYTPGEIPTLHVRNERTGAIENPGSIAFDSGTSTALYNWTPTDEGTTYTLTATLNGYDPSPAISVWTSGGVNFVYPIQTTPVRLNHPIDIIVQAENMKNVVLSIDGQVTGHEDGDMTKRPGSRRSSKLHIVRLRRDSKRC